MDKSVLHLHLQKNCQLNKSAKLVGTNWHSIHHILPPTFVKFILTMILYLYQ